MLLSRIYSALAGALGLLSSALAQDIAVNLLQFTNNVYVATSTGYCLDESASPVIRNDNGSNCIIVTGTDRGVIYTGDIDQGPVRYLTVDEDSGSNRLFFTESQSRLLWYYNVPDSSGGYYIDLCLSADGDDVLYGPDWQVVDGTTLVPVSESDNVHEPVRLALVEPSGAAAAGGEAA
ncbi:uncharacterized protein DSM5745_03663 [Aspergillus mulundensis]|uniref:Uncharacterized protein n=1 Tax=Aspergillus mulundensis TaxID=1810919 RepID=A0A3D8SLG4_9EURO|nr:hypothetical protein DSM5745_03663 [Aspergillus mulundensis]RDW87021.1 hypothetical protein DSM5745_03663 [Aspergillus mulundensis]